MVGTSSPQTRHVRAAALDSTAGGAGGVATSVRGPTVDRRGSDRGGLDHPGLDRLGLLRAIADPTRLAVLDQLAAAGPLCHCELEVELSVPANRLSFHLKVLREAGLVTTTREGRRVNYHLDDQVLAALHDALPGDGRSAVSTTHDTSHSANTPALPLERPATRVERGGPR